MLLFIEPLHHIVHANFILCTGKHTVFYLNVLSLAVNCAGTFFWTVTNLKLEINLKKILGGFYG